MFKHPCHMAICHASSWKEARYREKHFCAFRLHLTGRETSGERWGLLLPPKPLEAWWKASVTSLAPLSFPLWEQTFLWERLYFCGIWRRGTTSSPLPAGHFSRAPDASCLGEGQFHPLEVTYSGIPSPTLSRTGSPLGACTDCPPGSSIRLSVPLLLCL